MLISNAERQARTKRDADIEALRAATTKAELALVQAENDLLRQRVRALETALARRESAAKSAQIKAIRVIARLKERTRSGDPNFVKCTTGTTMRSQMRAA
jgi:hypothetical protein